MLKMERIVICALLLVLFTATRPVVMGKYYSKSHKVNARTTFKKTKLHFFLHDIVSEKNQTADLVAKPNGTIVKQGNRIPFGSVYVYDDPLTVGPSPNSEVIGRARGLYTSISRGSDLTLLMNGDLEFTSGEFNGSSISVFSRIPLVLTKELAIVGGTGKFRMANGFIINTEKFLNFTTGDAILEYNVTIFH